HAGADGGNARRIVLVAHAPGGKNRGERAFVGVKARRAGDDDVAGDSADDGVAAGAADEERAAGAAVDGVVAEPPNEDAASPAAGQVIVAAAADRVRYIGDAAGDVVGRARCKVDGDGDGKGGVVEPVVSAAAVDTAGKAAGRTDLEHIATGAAAQVRK